LIEHQTEPDRLMPLRVLECVVQIFKAQTRDWAENHPSFADIRLQPVLPVVFYTGTRRWDAIGRLADLVELKARFARVTPALEPLFLNLGATPAAKLEREGGFFGWVLRLVQQRRARPGEFKQTLHQAVRRLEAMPSGERLRWLELLSYIHALVYHERDLAERPDLQEVIEDSVQTDEHRREVSAMRRTIADELKEEGRKEGRKEGREEAGVQVRRSILLRHLRDRFGQVPAEIVARIEATDDTEQLDTWIDRSLTAKSLAKMGLGPKGGNV
jgi:hypothetical protein